MSSCSGIAKLLSAARIELKLNSSNDHLAGIIGPEAEGICSCMTIGSGGEAIAAGFEDGVDLLMGGEEMLRLPG